VVAVVIITIGAYVLGSKQTQTPVQNIVQTIQPSPTPDPTANPDLIGANWKTYTNSRWGFSLKYPLDATYTLDNNIKNGIEIWLALDEHTIYIIAVPNTKNLSLEKPKELFNNGPFTTLLNDDPITEILLDGYKAYRADNCCLNEQFDYWAETEIITIKNDIVYELRAEANSGFEKQKKINGNDKKIIDQIVSTFRFSP
jgi:hypothetical protein